MAASNRPTRTPTDEDDCTDAGVGMNHLTVVPTNFDAAENDDSDE
ncbi:hypothetical protein RBH26_03950 [Natronolimnohabitans sp. A-GB9]|nr:hypothetical protein [Natronolimnohabitans sp. A-GB9]MDQ2049630.1 hypothetical protein [Natronolimnohabitans sp. A-GB9]